MQPVNDAPEHDDRQDCRSRRKEYLAPAACRFIHSSHAETVNVDHFNLQTDCFLATLTRAKDKNSGLAGVPLETKFQGLISPEHEKIGLKNNET